MVTSGNLGSLMVSTLVRNAKDVTLIPALGAIFPIFSASMVLVVVTMILYKLYPGHVPVRSLCMYVIVVLKDLQFQGDECNIVSTDLLRKKPH